MEKKYAIGIVIMALLTMTMSVSANTNTVTMEKGVGAIAQWSPTPTGGYTSIFVSQATPKGASDMVTKVSVEVCDAGFVNCSLYMDTVPNSEFSIKGMGSLKDADLSSVTLPLRWHWGSPPLPTITVDAKWTGVGDITKNSFEFKFKSGNSIFRADFDSSIRSATATGTDSINGALGTTSVANLIRFRYADHILTKP